MEESGLAQHQLKMGEQCRRSRPEYSALVGESWNTQRLGPQKICRRRITGLL